MRKVKLTQAEIAASIALIDRAISDAIIMQRQARSEIFKFAGLKIKPDDFADISYWSERLHMLRALKAKLERDEEDEPEEPDELREEDDST